jgi:hypothetical protein
MLEWRRRKRGSVCSGWGGFIGIRSLGAYRPKWRFYPPSICFLFPFRRPLFVSVLYTGTIIFLRELLFKMAFRIVPMNKRLNAGKTCLVARHY